MELQHILAALAVISCTMLSTAFNDHATLSIYIHEGSLNGAMVQDIQTAGQGRPTGRNFKAITDVNGIAVINVNSGDCKFTFKKDGYKTLNLQYKVTLSGSV